jgi:valyl-tRNA synthetase
MNLDKYEAAGGETLETLAAPGVRSSAPYAAGGEVALIDRWIFSRLARATAQVNDALEHFRFHEAAHVVYHFFWGDFCDWYIEWVKPELVSADRARAAATWKNLFAAFESALRLLHPFMPFLTEELWQQLPQRAGARSIALDRFPEAHAERIDAGAEHDVALLQEIITAARNIRAEMKLDPKAKLQPQFNALSDSVRTIIENNADTIQRLANLEPFSFVSVPLDPTKGLIYTGKDFELFIRYAFDVTARAAQLRKEIDQLSKDIESKQRRLADETFRNRAPGHIVKGEESKLVERLTERTKLAEQLAQLEQA